MNKFKRNGLMIVFEGTDGSGKSTIINNLSDVLNVCFSKSFIDYYHWRPGVILRRKHEKAGEEIIITNPHAKKPYGYTKSFIKFMIINLDYIIGYWIKIRWQLAGGHLVIFDRYYYDYYIDKIRYRLNINDKMIDIFSFAIPKPDLTFLLIGDAQKLYERKKEISVEEIESHLERLLKNQNKFINSKIIDVNQDIEKVMNDVLSEIISIWKKKMFRRH